MAQLNITLNQEEILQLLSVDRDEAFRTLLTNSLNSILKAESQEQLRAAPYERSDERTDSRNGIRSRTLKTRIGTITLEVPRHRNQPFKTLVFDNCSYRNIDTIIADYDTTGISTNSNGLLPEERDQILKELFPPRVLADYQRLTPVDDELLDLSIRLTQTVGIRRLAKKFIYLLLRLSHKKH